nr:YciI family protein [uncultured Sphingosinicella sp.]
MHFIVIGRDKGDGSLRKEERPAHLEFVARQQHLISYAGPLLEEGRMIGSLFIFDVPDRAALDAYLAEDPYFTRPIFETIEIYESRRMVPESEPGFLLAEAERARRA